MRRYTAAHTGGIAGKNPIDELEGSFNHLRMQMLLLADNIAVVRELTGRGEGRA